MPVIVTSFEIAIRERKALSKLHYKYLVVDEGHRLKNSNCLLVQELKRINTDNKLLLTGEPPVTRSCVCLSTPTACDRVCALCARTTKIFLPLRSRQTSVNCARV